MYIQQFGVGEIQPTMVSATQFRRCTREMKTNKKIINRFQDAIF